MDQGELTRIFCARPQNFAWFLGAGASASAGLPTAYDVIWYLKRRFYCAEENQDISQQDLQIEAIKARIQQFIISQGFPDEGAPNEYTAYFEKIFGTDKERQRRFLSAFLSEGKVTLSVGSRVLAALMALGLCRVVFTTNFDTVLEKALAEVSGRSIAAFHLEGARSAKQALNNEEFPLYCKIHGDFRHDSIKNLPQDLAAQNAELSECLINAGNRFGFIFTGYSGRDESVMSLLHAVLKTPNPFPHGLFWTGMKGYGIPQSVDALLNAAQQAGVNAHYVEVETFDSLMLRLWRNTSEKTAELDRKVRKTEASVVSIPFGKIGSGSPLIRLNGLPILSLPTQCQAITFSHSKEWSALRTATAKTEGRLIFTKAEAVWCWGEPGLVREEFKDVTAISPVDLAPFLSVLAKHLHLKGFLEQALCSALSKGKPLLCRTTRTASFLIADRYAEDHLALEPLRQIVPKLFADIPGAFCPSDEKHPHREQISFAEAVRISIDERDGKQWLLLNPDVWIWPTRAREHATEFLDQRRKTRRNDKMNELLDAWIAVILGATKKSAEITLAPFEKGTPAENPAFTIGTRTAFARRSLP